ncbi:MAG: type II secretion system major pseudopilin GspG [Microbacteriaceae bacterium]|nr:type II secretion system major pseudopilin GspG [Burkholderiaceae bacterium]
MQPTTSAPPAPRRAASGFTLLELLVVMVIIGLLAAYVGPKYFAQIGKSEVTVARAQIEALAKALDTYRLDMGRYPTTEQGLGPLTEPPAEGVEGAGSAGSAGKWSGPYLSKKVPSDPWGHPYVYRSPGSRAAFDLLSYGRDGQPGGVADAADISH